MNECIELIPCPPALKGEGEKDNTNKNQEKL